MEDPEEGRSLLMNQHVSTSRSRIRLRLCGKILTLFVGALLVMMLIAISLTAFWRACYWWDPNSTPHVSDEFAETNAIGFGYFIMGIAFAIMCKMHVQDYIKFYKAGWLP